MSAEREGRPDFGPGDRVCYVGDTSDVRKVEGVYVDIDGRWYVTFMDGDYDFASEWRIVPEVSRLIRVTGPEKDIEALTHEVRTWQGAGVRVEVVE